MIIFLSVILTFVFTLNIFLTYSFFRLYSYRLPHSLFITDKILEVIGNSFDLSVMVINILHLSCIIVSLIVLILFIFMKDKRNIGGFSIRISIEKLFQNFIKFKGRASREFFISMIFIYNVVLFLLFIITSISYYK